MNFCVIIAVLSLSCVVYSKSCTQNWDPYCSEDGTRQFGNLCQLEIAQKKDKTLKAKQGECPKKEEDQVFCTDDWYPYCSEDGTQQFNNLCEFGIAQKEDPNLKATEGECAALA